MKPYDRPLLSCPSVGGGAHIRFGGHGMSQQRNAPFMALRPTLLLLMLIWQSAAIRTAVASDLSTEMPIVPPIMACADLASTRITPIGGAGSKITSTQETTDNGVTVCAVEGTLAPAIGFKIELPMAGWTQRYLQLGCGGLCGGINLTVGAADGNAELGKGKFAIAATDMGHQGQDPSFGRDPVKLADFAYRGVHLTAELSKFLIQTFYGKPPVYSYFDGCSDGGREALMETQRYPQDFNGVIAGAPAMLFQIQNSLHHGWLATANTGPDGKPILLGTRLPVLHRAVLEACDALDGQKDGLISDPRLCHFDPKSIQCAAGSKETSACLTAAEVEVARKAYTGPVDPTSGAPLTVGEEQYGSELAWEGVFVPHDANQPIFSTMIALNALQNLIFADPPAAGYSLADLKFTAATLDLLKPHHPLLDAANPDLSIFAASGGKLILWHGWADPHISPRTTIAYQEALNAIMGPESTTTFERLYLLPGVTHCGGGEGMASMDLLTPMMAWVEHNQAPEAIVTHTSVARTTFGQPSGSPASAPASAPQDMAPTGIRSRPAYPYPDMPAYIGQGDAATAANYQRRGPLSTAPTPFWAGESFLRPYKAMP